MASVLFAGSSVGLIVLPLMLFHQLQLMVCAALARRYAEGSEAVAAPSPLLSRSAGEGVLIARDSFRRSARRAARSR